MSDADLFTDEPAPGSDLFTDEPAPKSLGGFAQNLVSNAGSHIFPKGVPFPMAAPLAAIDAGKAIKEGLYDIPKAMGESSVDLLKGTAKAVTGGGLPEDMAEAVRESPIIKKTAEMTEPIAKDPAGYAYKNPVDAAMLAATPFMALAPKAAKSAIPKTAPMEEAAAPKIPLAEAAAPPPAAAPVAEAAAPVAAVPKELPIMQPGAKTGAPHALLAYEENLGEGIKPRWLYDIYGDPNSPAIKERGWGSSVPKEDLAKSGIPITGREPRSVKFGLPPEEEAPPAAGAAPPKPPPSTADSLADQVMDKAKEVKDYISRGYEGFAKKPGITADIADYIQGKSQKAAAQQMGMSPAQSRQMGKTAVEQNAAMRSIGQYALDNGIVGPTVGHEGMLARNAELLENARDTLTQLRKEADASRDPLTTSIDPLQQIKATLDGKYKRGAYAGQAGHYADALEDVEDAKPTLEGLAEAATKLNKAANENARINQPHGPYTDVANQISHINNERIRQILGPEKAAKYDAALKEFGVNKKIGEFLKRKTGGEVKRLGPGSFTSNMIQKGLDEFGYKAGAKVANKVSTSILKNPSIAKSLPALFKEFINQIEDVEHEVTGMYKGGKVPQDVRDYVGSSRSC